MGGRSRRRACWGATGSFRIKVSCRRSGVLPFAAGKSISGSPCGRTRSPWPISSVPDRGHAGSCLVQTSTADRSCLRQGGSTACRSGSRRERQGYRRGRHLRVDPSHRDATRHSPGPLSGCGANECLRFAREHLHHAGGAAPPRRAEPLSGCQRHRRLLRSFRRCHVAQNECADSQRLAASAVRDHPCDLQRRGEGGLEIVPRGLPGFQWDRRLLPRRIQPRWPAGVRLRPAPVGQSGGRHCLLDFQRPELEACLRSVLRGTAFPRLDGGERTTFRLAIDFREEPARFMLADGGMRDAGLMDRVTGRDGVPPGGLAAYWRWEERIARSLSGMAGLECQTLLVICLFK